MKKVVLFISLVLVCITISYFNAKVTRFNLPKGELKWSMTKPQNAKFCVPAAFTGVNNEIIGAYRINGKSHQTNKRRKVSLQKGTFSISTNWKSKNGFQQLTLVYNSEPKTYKDIRKCMRRALCKNKEEAFIIESNYPMTLTDFAVECSKQCNYAVNLDMGEYGYGYIRWYFITRPLHIWGYFSKEKQTNWLYIE